MSAIANSRRCFLLLVLTTIQGFAFARPKEVRAARAGAKELVGRLEMEALGTSKPLRALSFSSEMTEGKTILYRRAEHRKTPLCTMNPTGQMVWNLCDGRHSPGDISRSVVQQCRVGKARAERDVFLFLAELRKIGAIRV